MTPTMRNPSRCRRAALAALGILCTGLAALGAIVPGLPTTVFLIAASFLFARSSPRLERRLRGSRWFGPALRRLAGSGGGMPRRAKVAAIGSMWTGIAASLLVLWGSAPLQGLTIVLGLAGTATILFAVRTAPDTGLRSGSPLPDLLPAGGRS